METKRKYVVEKCTYDEIEYDNNCLEKELMRELGTFDSEEDVMKAIKSVDIKPDFGFYLELQPYYIDVEKIDTEFYDVENDDDIFDLFDDDFEPCDDWRTIYYDYKSIEGAIIVFWSWQTYVGYCRSIHEIRVGDRGETEELCVEDDSVYVENASVLVEKEDLEGLTKAEVRKLIMHNLNDTYWKWSNTGSINSLVNSCIKNMERDGML